MNNYSLFILFLFFGLTSHSQERSQLSEVLESVESQFNISFNYDSRLVEDVEVVALSRKLKLSQILKSIEDQTNLYFKKLSSETYGITEKVKICGYVQDNDTGYSLSEAKITYENRTVWTDENGFFEITISSVNELVKIEYTGFKTIKRQVDFFDKSQCKSIKLYIDTQELEPILLNSYITKGIDKTKTGNIAIDFTKFSLLPGLTEADVLFSIQSLPGIQSVDESVSNINIRGGSNDQNLVLWDDIKLYKTGHFFGLISSIDPNTVENALIVNNGTDSAYSDGVSGSIQMQTSNEISSKFSAIAGINFLSSDLFVDIPINRDASILISGRRSINDFIATPTYDNYFERIAQDTEIENNQVNVTNTEQEFTFYDTSLRYLHQLSENDKLKVNFLFNDNRLSFSENSIVNDTQESLESNILQSNIAAGIAYERTWNDLWKTKFQVYNTDYKLNATNADVLNNQRFFQENKVSETGFRILNTNQIRDKILLESGYNLVETEITNLTDVDNPRFRTLRSNVLRTHALFSQVNYSGSKGFFASAGARLNYLDKFEEFLFEPRLNVLQKVNKNISVNVKGEMKHQSTSQVVNFQNDFLGVERRRWQLTDNDTIPIIKSRQVSSGINFSKGGWLIDLTAYYKNVDGITTQSQGFTTKYEFTRASGSYNSYGLDAIIRKKLKNLSTWVAYSYIQSDYSFPTLEDIQFPNNFATTHTINTGITYTLKNLKLSSGFSYRTGVPTSIPLEENSIEDNEINFGVANSQRLDHYLRADFSAVYTLNINESTKADIGGSVWNFTNNNNIINDYYRINDGNTIERFTRKALGITTNVVARIYF